MQILLHIGMVFKHKNGITMFKKTKIIGIFKIIIKINHIYMKSQEYQLKYCYLIVSWVYSSSSSSSSSLSLSWEILFFDKAFNSHKILSLTSITSGFSDNTHVSSVLFKFSWQTGHFLLVAFLNQRKYIIKIAIEFQSH